MLPPGCKAWLEAAKAPIRSGEARQACGAELEAHLEDKLEWYLSLGKPPAEAEENVLQDMGDAQAVGRALDKEHPVFRPWMALLLPALLAAGWAVFKGLQMVFRLSGFAGYLPSVLWYFTLLGLTAVVLLWALAAVGRALCGKETRGWKFAAAALIADALLFAFTLAIWYLTPTVWGPSLFATVVDRAAAAQIAAGAPDGVYVLDGPYEPGGDRWLGNGGFVKELSRSYETPQLYYCDTYVAHDHSAPPPEELERQYGPLPAALIVEKGTVTQRIPLTPQQGTARVRDYFQQKGTPRALWRYAFQWPE